MKNSVYYALSILAGTLAISAAAQAADCKDESRYPEVSKKELTELVQKKKAFVIDVNSTDSYNETHVPSAMHYAAIEKQFAKKLPKNKNALIVAYCGGPQCAAWKAAAEKACGLGYKNIKHFKGGIKEWKEGS